MLRMRSWISVGLCLLAMQTVGQERSPEVPAKVQNAVYTPENYFQVTEHEPSATGRAPLSYSDYGAWFSYGLKEATGDTLGVVGPWMMTHRNGESLGDHITGLKLYRDSISTYNAQNAISQELSQFGHMIRQSIEWDDLYVASMVTFIDHNHAQLQYFIMNKDEGDITLRAELVGELNNDTTRVQVNTRSIFINPPESDGYLRIMMDRFNYRNTTIDGPSISHDLGEITIPGGHNHTIKLIHQVHFRGQNIAPPDMKSDANYFSQNQARWLKMMEPYAKKFKRDTAYIDLAAKCMSTLVSNWRAAEGEYQHDGLFPSHHQQWFHGFWSWDSWKHAAALARFEPELAKDQVRAMFDLQNAEGMVPDVIFRDQDDEAHNYRNTKPPLASWAVKEIYEQTGDKAFVEEMMPKLLLYHNWWNKRRNYEAKELFSYGAEDATLVAAKWESGMDNAARFDFTTIHRYRPQKHGSVDSKSVDLNCYLWWEENILEELLRHCEGDYELKRFFSDSPADEFWDKHDLYFFDLKIQKGYVPMHVDVLGPEGWTPLFTEAATQEQAQAVRDKIMDESIFNTHVPFPTLEASHEEFAPENGYWRGPVWIDQAYFGIKGLRNYGFNKEADELTIKLLQNCDGMLDSDAPLRENYNPLTGDGLNAKHFSWTAAHILLLLEDLSPEAIP